MKTLSSRLEKKRRSLLKRYDPEELHALRVTLRRMRSRLKQTPGKKARKLRQELGALADTTNAARDWDTLLPGVPALLPADAYEQLAPLLKRQQDAARERVIRMLQSRQWSRTVERWKQQEHRQPRAQDNRPDQSPKGLSRSQHKMLSAWRKALAQNDDKRWHKLRVTIKDLRYQLDVTPKKARSANTRNILAMCKQLQEDIGDWHDTVVHSQQLRELACTLDPVSNALACDALDNLRETIEERGRARLQQVKSTLGQPDALLLLAPAADRM